MEQEYRESPDDFHQFTLPEYVEFIVNFIEKMNPAIVIERFSGEVPPRYLHHSSWKLIRYDAVLRLIEAELEERDSWQGKYYT